MYINPWEWQSKITPLKGLVIDIASSKGSNTLVVQQASQALDKLKYEVAQELGIQIPQDGYYGFMTTRDTGSIGGFITRKLVQIAEQQLSGQFGFKK